MIFFSAHGVPVSYVEDAGDPYKDQMEECIYLIMQELKARGIENDHTLAYQVGYRALVSIFHPQFSKPWLLLTYLFSCVHCSSFDQSRVGPVEWLKPYTDKVLVQLGQKGVKSLLAVPIRYIINNCNAICYMMLVSIFYWLGCLIRSILILSL